MATLSEQLKKSVMSLARTNNGYFKSENQKTFLIEHLGMYEGLLGYTSGIKYKNPIFADYNSNGITKIYKQMMSSNKIETIFERKIEGELTSIEVKVLSSFKRKLKKLEKELENRLIFFYLIGILMKRWGLLSTSKVKSQDLKNKLVCIFIENIIE